MLVHRRVTPSIKIASTHLYTWVERGTVTVKCLVQKHNTMPSAWTQTPLSEVERTDHETGCRQVVFTKGFKILVSNLSNGLLIYMWLLVSWMLHNDERVRMQKDLWVRLKLAELHKKDSSTQQVEKKEKRRKAKESFATHHQHRKN